MIAGIGVDMTTISRVAGVYRRHGIRFVQRILHAEEMADFHASRSPDKFLAKRFAVKEAAVKALGTGQRNGILLRDFYISHDPSGKPELQVSGKALRRCQSMGIGRRHVSLSDELDSVIAYVVLEYQH